MSRILIHNPDHSSLHDALVPHTPHHFQQLASRAASSSIRFHPHPRHRSSLSLQHHPAQMSSSRHSHSGSSYQQSPYPEQGAPSTPFSQSGEHSRSPSGGSHTPRHAKSASSSSYEGKSISYNTQQSAAQSPTAPSPWSSGGYDLEPVGYGAVESNSRVRPRVQLHAKSRQRGPVPNPIMPPRGQFTPQLPQQLDYGKIMRYYNDIMAAASQELPSGRLGQLGEVMHLPALAGFRQFNAAEDYVSPADKRRKSISEDRSHSVISTPSPGAAADSGTPSPVKRQRADTKSEPQVCKGCDATSTPEWRRGPLGPRTLCNACGLVYAKILKRRSRDAQGSRHAVREHEIDSSDDNNSEIDSMSSPRSDTGDMAHRPSTSFV